MKKSMKKLVLLMTVLAVFLACFMITASAATLKGTTTYNGYGFSYYDDNTARIDYYTKNVTSLKMSSTVSRSSGSKIYDYTVTEISSNFFLNSKSTYVKYITYLRLPSTLKDIQNGLFQSGVNYLQTLEIYGAETTCNDYFLGCTALKEFVVNGSNTNLKAVDGILYDGEGATLMRFPSAKALTDTTIFDVPEDVTTIRAYAFNKVKNITEVNVPASVTTIGSGAFCDGAITAVNLDENSTYDASTYTCKCAAGTCLGKSIFCANGHKLEFIKRTEATCSKDSANVFECKVCGKTEERPLNGTAKGHKGGTATCVAAAVCAACGESYGEINADAHSFTSYTFNNDAACGKDGTKTATCANNCGKISTIAAEGTAKSHSFTKYEESAEAACGKAAQETASCDYGCGATDTRDIAGTALDHSFTKYEIIRAASCELDAQEKANCDNSGCRSYDVRTVKGSAFGHKAGAPVITGKVDATCDKAGSYVETVNCQNCNSVITSEMKTVPALDHADADGDYICDNGGEKLRSPQDDCTHMCHKSGFMGFIWKIVRFFQKLFKMNPVCECGAVHY